MRGRVKLGAHVGVVEKPIRDFQMYVHWSYFDISSGFLTNRPNVSKKRDFYWIGHLDSKYIGPCHVISHNGLNPIKLEEFTFQMRQEWKLCDQHCATTPRLADLRETHTQYVHIHTHVTMTSATHISSTGERVKRPLIQTGHFPDHTGRLTCIHWRRIANICGRWANNSSKWSWIELPRSRSKVKCVYKHKTCFNNLNLCNVKIVLITQTEQMILFILGYCWARSVILASHNFISWYSRVVYVSTVVLRSRTYRIYRTVWPISTLALNFALGTKNPRANILL